VLECFLDSVWKYIDLLFRYYIEEMEHGFKYQIYSGIDFVHF